MTDMFHPTYSPEARLDVGHEDITEAAIDVVPPGDDPPLVVGPAPEATG